MSTKDVRRVEDIVFAAIQDLGAAKAKLKLVDQETSDNSLDLFGIIIDIEKLRRRLRREIT